MLGVLEPSGCNCPVLGFHSPVTSLESCREGSSALTLYLGLTWISWNRNISFLWSSTLLNSNELERSKQIISTHSWHNGAVDKEQVALRAGRDQTTESLPPPPCSSHSPAQRKNKGRLKHSYSCIGWAAASFLSTRSEYHRGNSYRTTDIWKRNGIWKYWW